MYAEPDADILRAGENDRGLVTETIRYHGKCNFYFNTAPATTIDS